MVSGCVIKCQCIFCFKNIQHSTVTTRTHIKRQTCASFCPTGCFAITTQRMRLKKCYQHTNKNQHVVFINLQMHMNPRLYFTLQSCFKYIIGKHTVFPKKYSNWSCFFVRRFDCISRADYRFVPNQRKTALLCNDVSHWLGASIRIQKDIQRTPLFHDLIVSALHIELFPPYPSCLGQTPRGNHIIVSVQWQNHKDIIIKLIIWIHMKLIT